MPNEYEIILQIVDDEPGFLTTSEIVDQVEWSKPTVLKVLNDLYDHGRVKREGSGKYVWWTGKKTPFKD